MNRHDRTETRDNASDRPAGRRTRTSGSGTSTSCAIKTRIVADLDRARTRTRGLTDALDDAELVRQHSRLMSPLVWDLAHIGNQEELWLLRDVGGRDPILPGDRGSALRRVPAPARRSAGAAAARPGGLPALRRSRSDPRSSTWWTARRCRGRRLTEGGFVFGMIAQHEQQHAETMLATHQLRKGEPVLTAPPPPDRPHPAGPRPARCWFRAVRSPWAPRRIRGRWTTSDPRIRSPCTAFWMDTVPVTNADYQDFIADGGYRQRRWWHPDGLAASCRTSGCFAPLFWRRDGREWLRRRFGRLRTGAGRRTGHARVLVRGRRLRPMGGQAATHGGRMGEGRPPRSGVRHGPAVPVG